MTRFHAKQRVRMTRDDYEGIPKGTLGTIVGEDFGDTDIHTYEVKFDNGERAFEVRQYHMEAVYDKRPA